MSQKPRPYHQYLTAPASYWKAPEQVKERLCNGAGPDGLPSWVVPDTIYGLRITEAANIHDWMYVWGETDHDKEKADEVFLLNMMRIINEHTTRFPILGWVLRGLRHRRALKYWEAVAAFGDGAFATARDVRPDWYVPEDDEEPTCQRQ